MLNILVLTGGLEDDPFTAALTKSLRHLDHRVTLLSPLFAGISPSQRSLARRLVKLSPVVDGTTYACELYTGRNVHGVEQVFIGHPELFAAAKSLEDVEGEVDGGEARIQLRTSVFAQAAAQYVQSDITNPPEVVHGIGAAGSMALALLADADHPAARVLSASAAVLSASLDTASAFVTGSAADGDAVSAALAARHADDREGKTVHAISPGVDTATWNPLTDARIASRFDPVDRAGKSKCKAGLQRELALPVRDDVPLLGFIVREEDRRGLTAFVAAAPELLRNDVQLAIQVEGPGELVAALEELWDRFPDRLQIRTGRDDATTHAILGSADALVSLSEEGAWAREAQRYGSVPALLRDAPLADAMVDCDASLKTGTAFLADALDAPSLLATTQRVIAAIGRRDAYEALQRRVMEIDQSWSRAGHAFVRAYKTALPAREEAAE